MRAVRAELEDSVRRGELSEEGMAVALAASEEALRASVSEKAKAKAKAGGMDFGGLHGQEHSHVSQKLLQLFGSVRESQSRGPDFTAKYWRLASKFAMLKEGKSSAAVGVSAELSDWYASFRWPLFGLATLIMGQFISHTSIPAIAWLLVLLACFFAIAREFVHTAFAMGKNFVQRTRGARADGDFGEDFEFRKEAFLTPHPVRSKLSSSSLHSSRRDVSPLPPRVEEALRREVRRHKSGSLPGSGSSQRKSMPTAVVAEGGTFGMGRGSEASMPREKPPPGNEFSPSPYLQASGMTGQGKRRVTFSDVPRLAPPLSTKLHEAPEGERRQLLFDRRTSTSPSAPPRDSPRGVPPRDSPKAGEGVGTPGAGVGLLPKTPLESALTVEEIAAAAVKLTSGGGSAGLFGVTIDSPDTLQEQMRKALQAEEASIVAAALELIDKKAGKRARKGQSGSKAAKVASVTTAEVVARFVELTEDRVSVGNVDDVVLNTLLESREVDGISDGRAEMQWVRNAAAQRRPRSSSGGAAPDGSAVLTPDPSLQGPGASGTLPSEPSSRLSDFDHFWSSVTHAMDRKFSASATPLATLGTPGTGHYVLTSGNYPSPLHHTPVYAAPAARPSPRAEEAARPSLRRSGRKRPAAP